MNARQPIASNTPDRTEQSLGSIAVQLPELIRMAQRVETVHKNNANVPAGLASLLESINEDLLDNTARSEHIKHGEALDRINALTNDATPPQGACNTWRALYLGIAQFNNDLTNHIHPENNGQFPAYESAPEPAKQSGCGGGGGGCGCQ
jgi:regulator of cell morphogenesis and NO signaling